MISTAISIGRAVPRETEQITVLLRQQLEEHHVAISVPALRRAVSGLLEDTDRGFILVARSGQRCLGVASVSFIWALEHGGKSAWLEELFVVPEFRATGVGTKLLIEVINASAAEGCAALDVEIDADHERVRSLYERNGFVALPRRRMVKHLQG